MSRIGRLVITVPKGVQVQMDGGTFVAKGPKGEHRQPVHPDMGVELAGAEIRVVRPTEQTRSRSPDRRASQAPVPERPGALAAGGAGRPVARRCGERS